ncbi:MAG TPA: PAS domain-containing protein, partial [Candidatus Rifleibacterium sp.]|nr:PAS domain-containing protein [Candidatus Rifleibacterium sp.]
MLISEPDFLPPPSENLVASFYRFGTFRLNLKTAQMTCDRNFLDMLNLPVCQHFNDLYSRLSDKDQHLLDISLNGVTNYFTTQFKHLFKITISGNQPSLLEFSCRVLQGNTDEADAKIIEGLIRDASDLLQSPPDLSQSERWFMEVLEESPHALYRVNYRLNRFDYVSKGFAQALEMTREEVLAIPYTEFASYFHPDDIAILKATVAKAMEEKAGGKITVYFEFRFRLKSGSYVWLNDTCTIIPGADGQYAYQVGFGAVIEDRKRLEKQLRQANEHLEEKVRLRTSELGEANESLKALIKERRELEIKLLEISERERRFIGRELHDGLCQQVVGVTCMFETMRRRLEKQNNSQTNDLQQMRDYLHDTVLQIRTLARGLCPMALEPRGVGMAMSVLASQTRALYKIDCQFNGPEDFRIENP